MKYVLNEKEATQLKKQGYRVSAGEIVEVRAMPEWIRKRAEMLNASHRKQPAVDTSSAFGDGWTGAELRSLARALGADRNVEVRTILGM